MPGGFEVRGAEQLGVLSKRLKAQGEGGKGLRKELLAGVRKAAKPLTEAAKAGALADLPHRGGLAARVAASKFGVRTRSTGKQVGVQIVVTGKRGAKATGAIDEGNLRHPVYGDRKAWVSQSVTAGSMSRPMAAGAPEVKAEIQAALDRVAAKIVGG